MIQRIQTIFLFLAAAAGFGVLAVPFATTNSSVESSTLFADTAFNTGDNIGLLILFAVAGALALASLFTFRNRGLQTKLCRFGIIADVLGLILAVILFWQDSNNLGAADVDDGAAAYLSIGFLFFSLLALRYINKDEKLVRSMDRLR